MSRYLIPTRVNREPIQRSTTWLLVRRSQHVAFGRELTKMACGSAGLGSIPTQISWFSSPTLTQIESESEDILNKISRAIDWYKITLNLLEFNVVKLNWNTLLRFEYFKHYWFKPNCGYGVDHMASNSKETLKSIFRAIERYATTLNLIENNSSKWTFSWGPSLKVVMSAENGSLAA